MLISLEEINEARIDMGDYASDKSDEEIEELLYQIKRMAIFIVDFVEREDEKKKLQQKS